MFKTGRFVRLYINQYYRMAQKVYKNVYERNERTSRSCGKSMRSTATCPTPRAQCCIFTRRMCHSARLRLHVQWVLQRVAEQSGTASSFHCTWSVNYPTSLAFGTAGALEYIQDVSSPNRKGWMYNRFNDRNSKRTKTFQLFPNYFPIIPATLESQD